MEKTLEHEMETGMICEPNIDSSTCVSRLRFTVRDFGFRQNNLFTIS